MDAHLKIERAKGHIVQMDARIQLLKRSDVATVEINPEFGNEVIKHDITDRQAFQDVALIAGDAVHNLRCALDYSWIEVMTQIAPKAIGRFAKFPVYSTREELEAALREKEIHKAAPRLFNMMLTKIRPYARGDYAIWPIHRLDIRDKHRLLIPVILYSSISGIETEDKTGITTPGFTMGSDQEPPWYIHMHLGHHVKRTGEVSVNIKFEYGYRHVWEEHIYADELLACSQHIARVVEMLETFV